MTEQTEKLFNKVSTLPEETQNNLAFFWNDDIRNEENFDNTIYNTSDKIELMAKEAVNEYKHGKTIQKGIDELGNHI
jgi:hypothetical protein